MNIQITEKDRDFIGRRTKDSLTKYSLLHCTIMEIIETAYMQGMHDAIECLKEESNKSI